MFILRLYQSCTLFTKIFTGTDFTRIKYLVSDLNKDEAAVVIVSCSCWLYIYRREETNENCFQQRTRYGGRRKWSHSPSQEEELQRRGGKYTFYNLGCCHRASNHSKGLIWQETSQSTILLFSPFGNEGDG